MTVPSHVAEAPSAELTRQWRAKGALWAALVGVITMAGCGAGLRPPPAYPWSGFGRVGCYAGPALDRMHNGSPTPGDSVATTGPWLVLDSLSVTELYGAGYKDPIRSSYMYPGSLLERRDTVERTSGDWHRVPPDSVVFDEGTVFPPVAWHFRVEEHGLSGQGVLVHDVLYRGSDGKEHRDTSRWAVQLVRISCGDVPVVRWPGVGEGAGNTS